MAHPCYVCNFYPVPDGEGVECPHCHRLQYGSTCPTCGQTAPTVVRGARVFCSACGNARGPLAGGMPVNLAGQPSRVGSTVTRVAAWGTLLATVVVATLAGLVFGLISTGAGVTAAAVLGLVGTLVAVLMFRGSRALKDHGDLAQRHAREQAIFALAAHRGGRLTARDVAAALNLQLAEADAALTALARDAGTVAVDLDSSGVVHYVFRGPSAGTHVRVDPGSAGPGGAAPADEAAQARERVDREFEQLRARAQTDKR